MKRWRRAFHAEPELAYHEERTRDRIVSALQELNIPFRQFDDFTGVIGLVGENRPGRVVALRADMDALPVTEPASVPFHSTVPGRMHACGHDMHMACLLGAASILAERQDLLPGPVKLLFQPAEEEGRRGGALPLIERGALVSPKVDFVVGQHLDPFVRLGSVGWKAGPTMAAADRFIVTVRGTPGHAATPQQGPDAIVVAAEIVTGLQAIVSRMRDPLDPVVVTVGMVHGGTRHNVLPAEVTLEGTIRTLRESTRARVAILLRQRVRHIAASFGARASVRIVKGYPVLVNDPAATRIVVRGLDDELGPDAVVEVEAPRMAAEDFSRYLERVPGTFLRLGVGTPSRTASLHSPEFSPPEEALVVGAAALAAAATALQRA